jgi:hypothetical protein
MSAARVASASDKSLAEPDLNSFVRFLATSLALPELTSTCEVNYYAVKSKDCTIKMV